MLYCMNNSKLEFNPPYYVKKIIHYVMAQID